MVLCVESVDLPAEDDVNGLQVDPSEPPADRDGTPVATGRMVDVTERDWPYVGRPSLSAATGIDVPLIPYHSWANRGPSTMRVWIPVA